MLQRERKRRLEAIDAYRAAGRDDQAEKEEDELEICWNQARGKGSDRRPSAFTTRPQPGSGSVLYVLKRAGGAERVGTISVKLGLRGHVHGISRWSVGFSARGP